MTVNSRHVHGKSQTRLPSTSTMSSSPVARQPAIRAIPSSLAQKSSLSLPPSSQNYDPILKSILQKRILSNVLLLAFVFCWIQTATWTVWSLGGIDALGFGRASVVPFLPSSMALVVLNWVVAVVPIVLLRKRQLSGAWQYIIMNVYSLNPTSQLSSSQPFEVHQQQLSSWRGQARDFRTRHGHTSSRRSWLLCCTLL